MARCRLEGLDDLIDCFKDLIDDLDTVAEEALFEGGNVLRDNAKSGIRDAANRGYATGELESSIIPTTPEKNDRGHFVAVRPVGQNSRGIRNGEIWGYLEHGVPGEQEAHHFIDDALNKSESECAEIAQEVLDKHVKL